MKPLYLVPGVVVLAVTVIIVPARAAAQSPARPPQIAAWQQASPEARQSADALFAAGSRLFRQWQFGEAEQKYRAALAHWQHPLIYLYLGRALEKQGDLEGAHEAVQRALRQQPPPFSAPDLQLAQDLRERLEARLARIEVHCEQEGAEVFFDGEPWFVAPGRHHRMARSGQHVIIARKQGYVPATKAIALTPGTLTRVEIRMGVDDIGVGRPVRVQSTVGRLHVPAGDMSALHAGHEDLAFDCCPAHPYPGNQQTTSPIHSRGTPERGQDPRHRSRRGDGHSSRPPVRARSPGRLV